MEKSCSKCKITKDISCFSPRKERPGKYVSQCKDCKKEYTRNRRLSNPNKVKDELNRYKIINRESVLEAQRIREQRRMSDPNKYEEKKTYNRQYRKNNPIKYKPAFEPGDDVIYNGLKYKVLWVVRWKWFRIRKYWLWNPIIVMPKKCLTLKSSSLWT